MFRVLVKRGSISGFFAGSKPEEQQNSYSVSVADYDAPPDAYEEYPRIEVANEKADWCVKKGWIAIVTDELGNAVA